MKDALSLIAILGLTLADRQVVVAIVVEPGAEDAFVCSGHVGESDEDDSQQQQHGERGGTADAESPGS